MKNKNQYFNGFWNYHEKIMRAIDSENRQKALSRNIDDFIKPLIESDLTKIYKKVIAEINYYGSLGDVSIFSFLMELYIDDEKMAIDFMTSDYGGYTKGEARRILYHYNYLRNKNEDRKQKMMLNREMLAQSPS
jgi:hypothetical protein